MKGPWFMFLGMCLVGSLRSLSSEGLIWTGVDFQHWSSGTLYTYSRLNNDFGDYATLFNSWGVLLPGAQTAIIDDNGNHAIRVTYPAGLFSDTGSGAGWRARLDQNHQGLNLYFRARFVPGFQFVRGGKFHGLCSENCYTNGASVPGDGMSARFMWREVETGPGARAVVYTYHTDQPGVFGQDLPLLQDGPNKMIIQADGGLYVPETGETYYLDYEARDTVGPWSVLRLEEDTWRSFRLRIYLNSPGMRNGSIQAWVDGAMALNVNGFLFAVEGAPEADYLLRYMLFQTFHGGGDASWAPSVDVYADYDDFLVSPVTCYWADTDCGCTVDPEDLTPLDSFWGCETGLPCFNSDLDRNQNGLIEIADLTAFRQELGWTCPP